MAWWALPHGLVPLAIEVAPTSFVALNFLGPHSRGPNGIHVGTGCSYAIGLAGKSAGPTAVITFGLQRVFWRGRALWDPMAPMAHMSP